MSPGQQDPNRSPGLEDKAEVCHQYTCTCTCVGVNG